MIAAVQPGMVMPLAFLAVLLVGVVFGWMIWALTRTSPWSEEAYKPVRRASQEWAEAVGSYWSKCAAEARARDGRAGA